MKKQITSLLVMVLLSVLETAEAQNYLPKYQLIDKTDYPTNDIAVATYNVADYGVDNTGNKDCTSVFQTLLNKLGGGTNASSTNTSNNCYNITGGILYVPEGVYLFTGQLIIPRGVTIRGDRKDVKGNGEVKGTVFKISPNSGRGSMTESKSFITMQPSTEISNLIFWYPDQSANNIVAYPPTVLYGQAGYWGNDYCNVRHCTFVNSYIGIQFLSTNGGGCPNVFDIDGTPLHQGIVMDCIADVGRLDGIDFSPRFWANSGLVGSPDVSEIANYLVNNAVGIVMRRNDWSYTCNYTAENYHVGFQAEPSPATANKTGSPNGQNYNFTFKNCQTGINLVGTSGAGIMFTRVKTTGGDYGIKLNGGMTGEPQFYGCDINSDGYSVYSEENVSTPLMLMDCDVRGATRFLGGTLIASGNRFYKDVQVWTNARTTFCGNVMNDGAILNNESIFECKVDNTSLSLRPLPEFKDEWMAIKTTQPARSALYVVTDAEYGAVPVNIKTDLKSVQDNTAAIQKALTKAGNEGGGIVYLPAGHYKMDGTLNIPAGVELKGAGDIATAPKGNGAVLECYAEEGNESGTPFITMGTKSGLRGITINYPNQDNPTAVLKYPYAVRGNAGVYIVNLALRTAYRGVDLFTNNCDNHYVDYISGHCFMNVIRVGGNSKNGIVSNIQVNTGTYANGDETKYGCWPNSAKMADSYKLDYDKKAYGQNKEDLDFFIVGDCQDEVLYNNFLFGCNKGMDFVSDGGGGAKNVHAVGNAVDGAVNTFVVDAIGSDLDLVNSQIVAVNTSGSDYLIHKSTLPAYFMTLGSGVSGKNVSLFSSDNWGSGEYFVTANSGTINYYQPNLDQSGKEYTFSAKNGAKINFIGGYVKKNTVVESGASSVQVKGSVIECSNTSESAFSSWENNLNVAWSLASGKFIQPYRWTAKANNDDRGTIAKNGLSGANTSWSTDENQSPEAHQWFKVNLYNSTTFNAIILHCSETGGPAAYTVDVSDNGTDWTQVASGSNGGEYVFIPLKSSVTTKNVRINQTGTKDAKWTICEFNLANLSSGQLSGISDAAIGKVELMKYVDNRITISNEMVSHCIVNVYSLAGTNMLSIIPTQNSIDLSILKSGIYVVYLCGLISNERQVRKVLVKQ